MSAAHNPNHIGEHQFTRRLLLLGGVTSLICASAIVRAESLMRKQPAIKQRSAEEQSIIDFLQSAYGRPLTMQEINLSLDQARAIGDL